jgi:ring-1,2-phenylacetyl-CoA epoxidase subunit PaaD
VTTVQDPVAAAWRILAGVPDPEVPVVSVVDLGIARSVEVDAAGRRVMVTITPTYSGCPAMRMISDDIRTALGAEFAEVEVVTVLTPAWTTDWMSESGRAALRDYGIAPPEAPAGAGPAERRLLPVLGTGRPAACPQCGAETTERVSEFGSTPCKALYRCLACREPFDYFKCH